MSGKQRVSTLKNIAVVSMFLVFTALLYPQQSNAEKGPRLYCPSPTYDFGVKENNQVVEHTFLLQNRGTENLIIKNVRTSCGCTMAQMPKKTLIPGEETTVQVFFNLKGRRGNQHQTIVIESNDPLNPVFYLSIQGVASAEVFFDPPSLTFNNINKDTREVKTVTLISNSTLPVKITKIVLNSNEFSARLEKESDIVVETVPPLREGTISALLTVHTNHPEYQKEVIKVSARVIGELIVSPKWIVLSEGTKSVTRYINIKSGTVNKFEVIDIELPAPYLKADIVMKNGEHCKIKLSNLRATKDIDGKYIKIITDVKEKKTILIPIKVNSSK